MYAFAKNSIPHIRQSPYIHHMLRFTWAPGHDVMAKGTTTKTYVASPTTALCMCGKQNWTEKFAEKHTQNEQ